jgi:hypothetical protein
MAICKHCGEQFSNYIEIDGKKKRISNHRKYCFNCSPYGSKNTRNLDKNPLQVVESKCTCIICGREYIYFRTSGHTTQRCNSCLVNSFRKERKAKAIVYKGGKCQICGYDKCNESLTFHHLDPSKKDFNISGNHSRKWSIIQEELDKCILLCKNCHTEVEFGLVTI